MSKCRFSNSIGGLEIDYSNSPPIRLLIEDIDIYGTGIVECSHGSWEEPPYEEADVDEYTVDYYNVTGYSNNYGVTWETDEKEVEKFVEDNIDDETLADLIDKYLMDHEDLITDGANWD